MQVIELNLETEFQHQEGIVLGLGNFDGVHIAHQEIIKTCIHQARAQGLPACILTFNPHPSAILRPDANYQPIISLEQRLEIFKELGVDRTYVINFTKDFAALSAYDFVEKVLVNQLKVKRVVTGYNFFFGHNREGDNNFLHKLADQFGFIYQCIDKVSYNHHEVSSSYIKKMLKFGAIGIASALLGRKYCISGKIVKGFQRGRTIGFPTINIELSQDILHPVYGVYLAHVLLGGHSYFGIANIGIRPTFSGTIPLLEVHIFNFQHDVYGREVCVELLQFIRPERKFPSVDMLTKQIKTDVDSCRYVIHKCFHEKKGGG
jgi:riboflavin kinase/FMN adenylyltransferase